MTANLDRLVAALAADPSDEQTFALLEDAYFQAAEWDKLAALYHHRLNDPSLQDPRKRAPLHFRLGQVLEERCLAIDQAIAQYTEAAQIDPGFRPALRQLRQVHMGREAWDLVLQIAEVEIGALHEPYERASFFAEMGTVWLERMSEPGEAMSCFEQALAIDPQQKSALAGVARTLEAQGQPEAAAAAWERLIGCVRGPDRAEPLVALATLLAGPLHQGERAVELYRRALGDDPRNENAVEALSVSAAARGQWELLSDLYERRFSLAAGARRRTAIALEAGYMHLEQLGNADTARIWFERGKELSSDDFAVLGAFVDLERESGDEEQQLAALRRAAQQGGQQTPLRILLEAGTLLSERGDDEHALEYLELAQRTHPDDPLVLEALAGAYVNLLRHEELVSVLEHRAALAEDDAETRAAALIEAGQTQANHLNDDDAARDAFERAFVCCPDAPGLGATLEALYRKAESWTALRALLEQACEQGPEAERSGFHCSLGELLEEQFDEPAASAARYEKSLDLAPSPRALQGLSRLAQASGDGEAMIRALQREADMTSDATRLAIVCDELRRRFEESGSLETAIGWAERAASTASQNTDFLECLASLQERLGRLDDLNVTLTRLEEAQLGLDQAGVRRRLAKLQEQREDDEAAIAYWEGALESDPNDLESLSALRRHYAERGRAEDLAPVLRKLADLAPEQQRAGILDELGTLLEEKLCDLDGAIVILWRLSTTPGRPGNVSTRLESLLERAGRFEELAQQLLESRRGLPDDSEDAIDLDVRRAQLLLDPLGQFEEAVEAFRAARLHAPDREDILTGLERALRAADDSAGLARLLAESAAQTPDAQRREQLLFERAVLLEESLEELEQARQAYAGLCTPETSPAMATQAAIRLEALLERCGDWGTLRTRLEASLEVSEPREQLEIHERLASLCLDRMGDAEGCAAHLEASARIDSQRAEPWRRLAALYKQLDCGDDLLRVTEAELGTGPDPARERVLHARAAGLWIGRPDEPDKACDHYERLLELEPGRSDATEFLIDRYEEQNRGADIARLLEGRLQAITPQDDTTGADPNQGLQISLRLRIAEIRGDELNDPEGAIDALEPAYRASGAAGPATEPLADLYQATRRHGDLIELCEQAAQASAAASERSVWLLRLADCLRQEGEDAGAAAAYREVLDEHPEHEHAHTVLCDLYREANKPEPLVKLLESSLPRLSGAAEIAVRMELAKLLEQELARPEDALTHLLRVIESESDHDAAFHHALDLAERQGSHDQELDLLSARLEQRMAPEKRAELLERRASLLAGPLGSPEGAVSTLREVIALDPNRRSARTALRESLETLGRWTAVLDCLYVDAEGEEASERTAIYERAVEVATTQIGPDASLPWLERLRSVRPDDALVVARIADVHRLAGRFEAVLRALEAELALVTNLDRKRELHVGRARILERDMRSPGRAIAALEAARSIAPDDTDILEKLDELYAVTGRAKDRAQVIEARLDQPNAPDGARATQLHLAAAELYSEALRDPARAVPHLLRAVFLTGTLVGGDDSGPVSTPEARVALLDDLAGTLRNAGREEACARALEAQLAVLLDDLARRPHPDAAGDDAQDPRARQRTALHAELSWLYADTLGSHTSALHHMRVVVDAWAAGTDTGLGEEELGRLEGAFLDLLRQDSNWIELTQRLAARLERGPGAAEEWLELARLLDERLHAPQAASDAYEQTLALMPGSKVAIRGMRDVSERLGDWPAVVRTLELELDLPREQSAHEKAALSRRMGEICWHRLDTPDAMARATAAYASALAAHPSDLESLRALADLHQRQENWAEAIDLFEREAEVLGGDDAASDDRRMLAWLSLARIASEKTLDPARATSAYERAAEIGTLEAPDQRALADLYDETGAREKHAEAFAAWLDDERAEATCDEHLALVEGLIELSRRDEALERARRATEVDDESADAWATVARLLEERGEASEAADAWERAGELRRGPEAAQHMTSAALLVEETNLREAVRRLRGAVEMDPASAVAHCHLARVTLADDRLPDAEGAAARGLDLAAALPEDSVPGALQLRTAIVGGSAARGQDRLEAAVLFFGVALEFDPESEEALESYAELLFERGDLAAARGALEARLDLPAGANTAAHLSMLGSVLELAGETDAASERFREAVARDASWGAGHAGVARLAEKAGRTDEAIAALEGWAQAAKEDGDVESFGARLLRATELELTSDRTEAAEALLRRICEDAPDLPRAWVLLTEILADAERVDDLLETAAKALERESVLRVGDAVARLALLRARALEQRGDLSDACDAYGEATRHDPRSAESALARARLLRARGDWTEAADVLRCFCEGHPEPDHRDLAEPHYKLARLLAGPLEDMDAAIREFERSLEIAPDHAKAREPLASLLSVMPERWSEAIVHHAALLEDEPTRAASLRSLLQIAKGRGNDEQARFGLAVLRGMGAASPSERAEAPDFLPRAIVETPCLEEPAGELARHVLLLATEVLDQVLGTPAAQPGADAVPTTFAGRLQAAERDVCGAGLEHFDDPQLGDLVCTIAAMSLGDDADDPAPETQLDATFVRDLDRALGRWTRRKIRRALEGRSLDSLRALDYGAWRVSLQGLAAAVAVDTGQGDLRTALTELCRDPEEAQPANESEDWSVPIQGHPAANELLRRVATSWCSELAQEPRPAHGGRSEARK